MRRLKVEARRSQNESCRHIPIATHRKKNGGRMEGEKSSVESPFVRKQSPSGFEEMAWVQARSLHRGKKHDKLVGGPPQC